MTDNIISKQDKVISLFKFIEEMNKLRQKVILNVSEYNWFRPISTIPSDSENIHIYYRDRVEIEDEENIDNVLLSVHKPEFQNCPKPDDKIKVWLNDGWDNFESDVSIKEYIKIQKENKNFLEKEKSDDVQVEYFQDNKERIELYNKWMLQRNLWAEKQKIYAKTRRFFTELYKVYIDMERESESLELIVADGFICDKALPNINHPVLTRRVKIRHDAAENVIYIEDSDNESQLYTIMFQNMKDVNLASINHMNEDLSENDYHPLDRNDLPEFFKALVHQLSAKSIYSEQGIPENWQITDDFLLYRNPCYILRKRLDGTLKAIEELIDNVEKTGDIPNPIADIVQGGKIEISEEAEGSSIEEQLAAVGGESIDILLSKEANKEQLEIAKRIERYNAVLVQGPPGTGKTHTIANLMGHFLAQGKSVLVTSHTQKALNVLKEKIVPGLQNLCVSVLDDSNVDMEKSIDGITSYMSQNTSYEVKKEMESLNIERKDIINKLANVRKKLFTIINQESNNIVFNGESISLSKAAKFVCENSQNLSYIPGNVKLYEPIPLSSEELAFLYHSNGNVSLEEETELESDIPSPDEIISPIEFEAECKKIEVNKEHLKEICEKNQWKIQNLITEPELILETSLGSFNINYQKIESVKEFKKYIAAFGTLEKWMQYCAVDGKNGGAYKEVWLRLVEQIRKTSEYSAKLTLEKFGKDVKILNNDSNFYNALVQLRDKYKNKEKLNKLDLLLHPKLKIALNGVTINNRQPQSVEDCELVLDTIAMEEMRNTCANYWNDLIAKYGIPQFKDLSISEPENIALKYVPLIERYLDWYANDYITLKTYMETIGLSNNIVFQNNVLDSDITMTNKVLNIVTNILPLICDTFEICNDIHERYLIICKTKDKILSGRRINSNICKRIVDAIDKEDVNAYRIAFGELKAIYEKSTVKRQREEYINRISFVAPEWAEAISKRSGVHGADSVPENIIEAWKWKQFDSIIKDIISEPYTELQKNSLYYSKRYRDVTAAFAEKCAWYNLLKKTENDIDMKQALIGWKQTIKKIGKGTGKNAPMYREKARKLMAKCQNAVPGWIMPISKALESLNPQKNKFDVIIIDEASQSDISSLAILYMGRKLVIVGDDKQVSPMAIGIELDRMNALNRMYIESKIPNSHLYDAKTSIYDIAATTFQPLMLREHFRCMPEIIGFSNMLSYDNKIKPLRDDSNSVLLPAVINYRVKDGQRVGKTNPNEAKTIVALMRACMEQPEYTGKTFGVISLLGDEQVKLIQSEIFNHFDAKEIDKRKILCGNASNFQGDERDVIFLSMVDCANGNGPMTKQGFGVDDAYRKRYNVAVSRARDQLWVVNSIDSANDLKPGDIRKILIDYAINPHSIDIKNAEIDKNSESPFESSVAKSLVSRGYHLVQQRNVGAYRLDIVAVFGNKKVAIECDGERYHSGENKIREDMERQTILERLGWRFIRIRGSEYYRNPDLSIERVIKELDELGIEPEDSQIVAVNSSRDTELLQRIKARAHIIITAENTEEPKVDFSAVKAALDVKNDIIGKVDNYIVDTILEQKKRDVLNPEKEIKKDISVIYPEKTLKEESKKTLKKTNKISKKDIIQFLNSEKVKYVDNRSKGGSLWIIGGIDLYDVVQKAKLMGIVFRFKKDGGRATKNQPGWWAK